MDGQIEIPDFDDEPQGNAFAFGGITPTASFGFNTPAAGSSKQPWGATNLHVQNTDFAPLNFNDGASSLFTTPQASSSTNFSATAHQNASSSSLASSHFQYGASSGPAGAQGHHSRNRSLGKPGSGASANNEASSLQHSGSSASINGDASIVQSSQIVRRYGPPELALALVIDDFSHRAEIKIDDTLKRPVEQDMYLPRTLAEGVDPQFDRVLVSVAQLSKTIPDLVIDHLMRWRKQHTTGVEMETARKLAIEPNSPAHMKLVVDTLNERKSVSCLYLLCRALTAVAEVINTDLLGNDMGAKFEELVYNTIRRANVQHLERSPNRKANIEGYARLAGSLSAIRFQSVTDRFLKDLKFIPHGVSKDQEATLELLVRCMRWIRLKVYPMEAFEEAAELLETMADIFDGSSGERMKRALALTLNQILEAIVLTASAEVNHPLWSRAMQIIHAKASDMVAKPRYITAAMPLVATSISASPEDFLLANFNSCLNLCIGKLKDRPTRLGAFYGILQLLWSYLRRCHETHTGVSRRLEPIIKTVFPPGKRAIYPPDIPSTMTAIVPHVILQHHFELGCELLDTLLNPSPPISTDHWPPEVLCHERKLCAITALLYSLDATENGKDPVMPPAPHIEGEIFVQPISLISPSVTVLPETVLARGGWRRLVDLSSAAVARIAIACDKACESFKVLDDRNVVFSGGQAFHPYTPDRENHIQRRHGAFTVTYPRDKQPMFDLLRTCIDSWPRLLAKPDTVTDFRPADILIRCLLHIDIDVYIAARKALERLSAQPEGYHYVRALTRSVVRAELVLRESSTLQNANTVKLESLVGLWNGLVEILVQQVEAAAEASGKPAVITGLGLRRPGGIAEEKPPTGLGITDPHDIWPVIIDVEATALVLSISQSALIRRRAADALQLTLKLQSALHDWNDSIEGEPFEDQEPRVVSCLQEQGGALLEDLEDDFLDRSRVKHWKRQTGEHILLRLAQSDSLSDLSIWQHLISPTFKSLLDSCPSVMSLTRALLAERLVKGYSMASAAAGLMPGRPAAAPVPHRHGAPMAASSAPSADLRFVSDYWKMHLTAVCSVTIPDSYPEPAYSSSLRDASDINNPAAVVRVAIAFLASDEPVFREATIFGLGCMHQSGYIALLQALNENVSSLRKNMDMRPRPGFNHSSHGHASTRHARTFASVARVYERSSILMKQSDVSDEELGMVAHAIRDMLRAIVHDQLPLDCRRAFSVTLRHFVEHCGNQGSIRSWLSPQTLYESFRLCEQWTFFQRPKSPNTAKTAPSHARAHSRSRSDSTQEPSFEIFLPAVQAIASLCEHNAITLKRYAAEPAAIDPPIPLRWAQNLFSYNHPVGFSCAKRVLGALINYNLDHKGFLDHMVQQCFNEPAELPLQQSTFSVVSGALIAEPTIAIKTWTAIILALWKVGQPDLATRQRALDVIALRLPEHQRAEIITSCQSAIYTRFIGDILDMRHRLCGMVASAGIVDPKQAFLELAIRNLQHKDKQTRSRLQMLPIWLAEVSLPEHIDKFSTDTALANIFLLTSLYWDIYPTEIRAMWTSMISPAHPHNLQSVVQFLVDQSQLRGMKEFTKYSQQSLAALCQGEHDARVLAFLSDFAQPSNSVMTDDSRSIAEGKATNLESVYPLKKKSLRMSTAQTSVLLASDVLLTRLHTADPNIIRILHVLLLQADHVTSYIRREAREILQRAMTLLKKLDRVNHTSDAIELAGSAEVEWSWHTFWDHEEESDTPSTRRAVPNMERFIQDALRLLETIMPDVRRLWGIVALEWAVSCPVRHMACRSFQALRLLSPQSDQRMLAEILGRLSETISDTAKAPDARLFAREILHTLITIAEVNETPLHDLPQLWWSFLACATTTNEEELVATFPFGQAVLDRLANDEAAVAAVQSYQPDGWPRVPTCIRSLITRGVRSASTIHPCWEFAQCLMRPAASSDLVDAPASLHLVYAFTLQWGLDAMETSVFPPHFDSHCARLAQVADNLQEEGIARTCRSLGKNRFRTKEDFVREAASNMKEYFTLEDQLDTFVLYLGSLQNALVWVRERTLVLLKSFFHQVQLSQADVEELGSDQLSPLIQLLPTDMAPMALDVLGEHVPLHSKTWSRPTQPDGSRSGSSRKHQPTFSNSKLCFGKPELSGWSVGDPAGDAATTRMRLRQVVDTCETVPIASNISSPLAFAAEAPNMTDSSGDATKTQTPEAGDTSTVSDMMNTLSSLASFWDATLETTPSIRASQSVGTAPRIAAVLSRSLRSQPSHSSHFSKSSLSMTTIPEMPPSPTTMVGPSSFDEAFAEPVHEDDDALQEASDAPVSTADGDYFGQAGNSTLPWDSPEGETDDSSLYGTTHDSHDSTRTSRARPFGWTRQGS